MDQYFAYCVCSMQLLLIVNKIMITVNLVCIAEIWINTNVNLSDIPTPP